MINFKKLTIFILLFISYVVSNDNITSNDVKNLSEIPKNIADKIENLLTDKRFESLKSEIKTLGHADTNLLIELIEQIINFAGPNDVAELKSYHQSLINGEYKLNQDTQTRSLNSCGELSVKYLLKASNVDICNGLTVNGSTKLNTLTVIANAVIANYFLQTGTTRLNVVGDSNETRLNNIRGTVDPNTGNIVAGGGFTISSFNQATGTININFDQPFSSLPTIIVTPQSKTGTDLSKLGAQIAHNVSNTGFTILNISSGGITSQAPLGSYYCFIAQAPVS